MTDKSQEQLIAQLKIRAFDASEEIRVLSQENEIFKSALLHIGTLVGINGAETTVQQLVDAVTAAIPHIEPEDQGAE